MDSKQFIKDAIRTESLIEKAQVSDAHTLYSILRAFVASATLLDMLKKNIYYGKEISQEKWTSALNNLTENANNLKSGFYPSLANTSTLHVDPRVLHGIIGIATESSELIEATLNHLVLLEKLDSVNVQEEIGDIFWYVAILIDSVGGDWDTIQETVIAKLKKRYPDKFTSENAINRDLDAERKLLEDGLQ